MVVKLHRKVEIEREMVAKNRANELKKERPQAESESETDISSDDEARTEELEVLAGLPVAPDIDEEVEEEKNQNESGSDEDDDDDGVAAAAVVSATATTEVAASTTTTAAAVVSATSTTEVAASAMGLRPRKRLRTTSEGRQDDR